MLRIFSAAGKSGLRLLGAFKWTKEMYCRRSTKQTTTRKKACFSGETARYLLLLMPRSSASHLLIYPLSSERTPPPNPPNPNNLLLAYLQRGWRSRWNGAVSLAGSLFYFILTFFLWPWRRNEVLRRRWREEEAVNWNFKMVLIVCTFLHSCFPLPPFTSPLPQLPFPFISITPAIMTLRRKVRDRERGSTLEHSQFLLFCIKVWTGALMTCTI